MHETCAAIWDLREAYLRIPASEHEWQRVADGFQLTWNMPNCIGILKFYIFYMFFVFRRHRRKAHSTDQTSAFRHTELQLQALLFDSSNGSLRQSLSTALR